MGALEPRLSTLQQMWLYESAVRPPRAPLKAAARAAWTAAGLGGLLWVAWAEPWSARWLGRLADRGASPAARSALEALVYAGRAVLLIETWGYAYHRFFQHLGWFTRRAAWFRRNQMYHWIHHMVIYPIGRFYRRPIEYVSAERGIAWSWVLPGAAALPLWVAGHHAGPGDAVFPLAAALYAKLVIDAAHSRFHETAHRWSARRYFRWLEEIHLLHHWDQRTNFTIAHPAMDWLFGTYRSPAAHRRELALAAADGELTASDLINWRYLLIEATPAEHAAFISQARRHPRSARKLERLRALLATRLDRVPNDALARTLAARAGELWAIVRPIEAS